MTLLQLKYFQTACRLNSLSQAAKALHVTQPSISMAIKNLENEFAVTLISHQRNSFSLTQNGEIFLAMIDDLLEKADHVTNVMNDIGHSRHLIRLGIPPMIGNFLFPEIYMELPTEYQGLHIMPKEAGKKEIISHLEKNLLDLAFIPHVDPVPSVYNCIKIMDVETVCCVSNQNPLSKKKIITPLDLKNEAIIMFQTSYLQRELITKMFFEADISPKVLHESTQLSTIQGLIAKNLGVGFMFRNLAESCPKIKMISLNPQIMVSISLIWRKDIQKSEAMLNFIEFVKKIVVRDDL